MSATFQRVSVIGAGGMGTCCALVLAESNVDVCIWCRRGEHAAQLNTDRENRAYLPGFPLPSNVRVTADPGDAFAGAELLVAAVPCQHIRPTWQPLAKYAPQGVPIVSVAKGIDLATLHLPTDILAELVPHAPMAALSGPSIAPELAGKQPCALVAASKDIAVAERIQHTFSNAYLRVYASDDLLGVEIAGAVKNIIALAAGILDGMRLGSNAKAALLTRGVVEVQRLGVALGARATTFNGLACVGDLVTTCISPVSRNRSAGEKIGQGMRAEEVLASTASVIEGIPTTRAVLTVARRHGIEMPITEAVASVLDGRVDPAAAITALITRPLTHEFRA